MRTYRRRATAIASAATLGLLLSACGGAQEDSAPAQENAPTQEQAPADEQQAPPAQDDMATGGGVTTAEDAYGPGCAQVPTEGEGSVEGMIDDPVGSAAGNNPLLTKLTAAVGAAGLGDTLNQADAEYTVFAPADPAFDELPPEQLDALLNDPAQQQQLSDILTYHVVPQRMTADQIAQTGTLETVQGRQLMTEGEGEGMTVNGANVLCGNVPTANATVFVIDQVLMPEM